MRKLENALAAAIVCLLAVLPLVFKVFQDFLQVQIPDADSGVVNLVFVYACLAGLITLQDHRHLALAALADKMPEKVRNLLHALSDGVVACFITAAFFNAVCQVINPDQLSSTAFAFPLKLYYAALPVCYILILCCAIKHTAHKIAAAVGCVAGLLIAAGPITGILYYLFGMESVPVFTQFNGVWILFTGKAFVVLVLLLVLLAFAGVPLFIILGGVSYIAFSQAGGYVDVIPLETYRILTDKSVAAIPLFTIAGYILSKGSAGRRFIAVFNAMFGWFRGGTVVATVIVLTFFTTFTGVSGVTILALGALLSVILKGSGYTENTAEALITSCSALGLMFPPSVAIIMYATTNYFSVDVMDLFKGVVLPGCLMAVVMVCAGVAYDKRRKVETFSLAALGRALKDCIGELLMPACICAGYFSGFFDLFQTAAFAVVYTFLLAVFIRKDFTIKGACEVIAESVPVSGGVLFIMGAASGVSYFMLDADVPGAFTMFITQYVSNKYVFLILMNILLLIVGCLMDIYSAILIVSPLLLPIAEVFGITAVQAGVIFLMNLSLGFLTPPVGMDLFIASYTFKKPMSTVIKGVLPFLGIQFLVLMLVTYVPWFTTVLLK